MALSPFVLIICNSSCFKWEQQTYNFGEAFCGSIHQCRKPCVVSHSCFALHEYLNCYTISILSCTH
eukprot:XP_001705248.1 Hypothetical protein GL50803_38685 [Giardia lamblia ATCC 50803]